MMTLRFRAPIPTSNKFSLMVTGKLPLSTSVKAFHRNVSDIQTEEMQKIMMFSLLNRW